MQKDDLHKKDIPLDTVLRKYDLSPFEYKLQPNDLIYIDVKSLTAEDFDVFRKINEGAQRMMGGGGALGGAFLQIIGYLVDQEGYVELPLEGKVKVAGLSVFEAEERIKVVVSKYLESPLVKVRILNYRATVLGEVNKEGLVVLENNRVTLLEAIGKAGGLGELADRSNIKLIRQVGDQTSVQYINLLQEQHFNSPFYYVHQNDVIIVPPLKQRPFRRYFGQNVSLFVSSISTLLLIINLLAR